MVKQTNNRKGDNMAKLKKLPKATSSLIEPSALVEVLKSNHGSMPIMNILLHFGVIQDPSDISSSKRAILRKARKGWTINDKGLKVKGQHYWTFVDGKTRVDFEGHDYTSGIVRLLSEKEAREEGLI
tara:strand:- start:58 stop:438 length:381 start_codon:yes stop_codon:yes gene_type:complete